MGMCATKCIMLGDKSTFGSSQNGQEKILFRTLNKGQLPTRLM